MQLKKADIFLIVILCVFALFFVFIFDFSKETGSDVVVKVDGKIYEHAKISKDKVIRIYDKQNKLINEVKIENGKAYMAFSNCHDKICIKQGQISHTHESIVCLPNKVVVSLGGETELDSVSR